MISNQVNIGPGSFVSIGSSGTSTNPKLSQFAVRTWKWLLPVYPIYVQRCPGNVPEMFGRISHRAETPISMGYLYDILGYPTDILFICDFHKMGYPEDVRRKSLGHYY